jgi:hypothetical protein
MPRPTRLSRRRFLAQSALAGASAFAAPALLRSAAPNERLNLAFIGAGGRGGANLREMTSGDMVNVVALCDVNADNLGRAALMHPLARKYVDFRKLYDDAADIDGVVVSTTEHTHAYATMPALKLKKHVYCEKPLTRDVQECRLVTAEAARAGVVTQMGTQVHGWPNYRRVVELIQSGAIGPVHEAHVWVSRAWGLQSKEDADKYKDIVYVTDRPEEAMTPPESLDWDLWLGPAPERPFHEVYFPGPKWYRWWDFGNGTMSDLGSHWNDLPFWALKLDAPRTIEAIGPAPHAEIAPASMTAIYEYGPRGDMPACRVTWHQGTHKPEIWTSGGIPQWDNGVLFIGAEGMVLADYSKHILLPEEKFKDFQRPEPFIADSPGQHQEWLIACRTGGQTSSPFSYSGPLTEANHLGNVAFRAGRKLDWDSANLRVPNFPEAEKYLSREPRTGWSLS